MSTLNVIITGATGMVGEGVLLRSLEHPAVASVLVINRRPCGISHPKLREVIHADFFNFKPIEQHLSGYNACFFCLGVSSVGMAKEEYYQRTYVLTLHVAQTLSRLNPDMTFCYVSGGGTDSSEKGRLAWARVKGKTENDLLKLPFKAAYNFRPGFIKPFRGMKNTLPLYRYILWLFPLGRALYPAGFCTMEELALSMIRCATQGYNRHVLEGKDIILLGKEK